MPNNETSSEPFSRMLKNVLDNGSLYTAMWIGLLFIMATYLYLPSKFSSVVGIILCIAMWKYDDWRPERKLYDAIDRVDVAFLTSYLNRGGNINFRSIMGTTMLHVASAKGNIDIISLLMKYNADLNALTNSNKSPLHFAVMKEHILVIDLLLKNGAEIDIIDSEGKTPYDLAVQLRYSEIADLLASSKVHTSQSL